MAQQGLKEVQVCLDRSEGYRRRPVASDKGDKAFDVLHRGSKIGLFLLFWERSVAASSQAMMFFGFGEDMFDTDSQALTQSEGSGLLKFPVGVP